MSARNALASTIKSIKILKRNADTIRIVIRRHESKKCFDEVERLNSELDAIILECKQLESEIPTLQDNLNEKQQTIYSFNRYGSPSLAKLSLEKESEKSNRLLADQIVSKIFVVNEFQDIEKRVDVLNQKLNRALESESDLESKASQLKASIKKNLKEKRTRIAERLQDELDAVINAREVERQKVILLKESLADLEPKVVDRSTKVILKAFEEQMKFGQNMLDTINEPDTINPISVLEKNVTIKKAMAWLNGAKSLSFTKHSIAEERFLRMEKRVEEKERNSKYPTQTTQTESGLSIVEERLLKMEKVVLANEKKANEALKRFGNITDKEFYSITESVLYGAIKLIREAMSEGIYILVLLRVQGVETKSDIQKLETKKKPWMDRLEQAQNDNDQELVEDCQTWLEQAKVLENQNEKQLDSISQMRARIVEIHPQLEKLAAKIEKRLETLKQAKESTQ